MEQCGHMTIQKTPLPTTYSKKIVLVMIVLASIIDDDNSTIEIRI